MKKKALCLLLACMLMLSLLPTASAAEADAQKAAEALHELGLFNGVGTDANGNPIFDLDAAPDRQQAVTMLVRLLGKEDEAKAGSWNTPFTDVSAWAAPYVGYAYENGLTNGMSATTFGGSDAVTATHYLTFILRALGYLSGVDFRWDTAWALSDRLGITNGEYNADTSRFTRGDVAKISYAALSACMRDSTMTLQEYLASGSETDSALHPLIYANGEYQWLFHTVISNDTADTLTLKKVQIIQKLQGKDIGGKYIFEGDRLANLSISGRVLSPGQCSIFDDGHPLTDAFDEMLYIFTYQTASGQEVVREKDYLLSHEKPATAYKDYSRDNGLDLDTLRYSADYCVNVASGVYWVPASSLGGSSYTNAEIQTMLTATPEEKQAKIDTLYEALQLYQIGNFSASDDNIRISDNGIDWEFHKPGYDAVRTNTGCCATDSNWLRYILDGDYEEVGYMATSQRDGGGHIYNYIKMDGWYYFIDLTHYRTDWVATAVETGELQDYWNSDRVLGNIHKVRDVQDYVNYVQSAFTDPPGLMFFYTAENCLTLDSVRSARGVTITYETVSGIDVKVVFDDPNDTLYYQFIASPKVKADFSTAQSFDFAAMKFQ